MDVSAALPQRILDRYNDMPRGERRLADMLLENSTAILDSSATQLAERAGVSKATAARFFKRLGYASFKAAQRSAREQGVNAMPAEYGARLPRIVGLAYLFISHDMAVVELMSHRVAVMHRGRIVEMGPRAAVLNQPRHPYTTALLAAVSVPDPARRRGHLPKLDVERFPNGPLEEVAPGHLVAA